MSAKPTAKPVIHGVIYGVMDDAWARRVNNIAIDILAQTNNWVITKRKLTPKAGAAVPDVERPSA